MDIQKLSNFYNHSAVVVNNVYRVQHEPGFRYAGPTIEEDYGLVFTLSGEGKMQFNDAKGIASNNTVFHGGPDCWHDYATVGENKWDIIIIAYDIIGSHSNDMPGGYYLNTYQTPAIKKLLVQLYRTQEIDKNIRRLRANSTFYNILSEMLSNSMDDQNIEACDLYSRVSAYIEDHCTQDLDILSIARQFGIKENRLYYVFRKFSDVGPAGHLNNCRMKQAAELLKTGGLTVEDVALTVGYSDGFSFSKQFKKKYGIAPSFFQKMCDSRNGYVV
ncbi:AraC family transcriptional regulator [Konateibacter massiliensis]|uniref:AraC family transcriptional regulator n=1 Tax=Konateibacter massiliensis TaxID=2002841 RepID=UPI0015D4996F|nr:AraC family transcriptional regulator [Konateibacter massiliensis]